MLEQLRTHHDQLQDVLDRVWMAMVESDYPETAQVARLRWKLARALRTYKLFKDGEIFNPLIRYGTPEQAARAQALKMQCDAASADYDSHVRRWTLYGLVDRWAEYRAETIGMVDRIRAHLAEEKPGIRHMLAGMDRIRLA